MCLCWKTHPPSRLPIRTAAPHTWVGWETANAPVFSGHPVCFFSVLFFFFSLLHPQYLSHHFGCTTHRPSVCVYEWLCCVVCVCWSFFCLLFTIFLRVFLVFYCCCYCGKEVLAHDLHEFFRSFSTRLALARFRVRCKNRCKKKRTEREKWSTCCKPKNYNNGRWQPWPNRTWRNGASARRWVKSGFFFFFLKRNGAFD